MERVWPGRIVDEKNLPIQITALRRAFGADRYLNHTVPGRGYQFTGEVRTVSSRHDALPDPTIASVRAPTSLAEVVSELMGREVELGEMLGLTASQRLSHLSARAAPASRASALRLPDTWRRYRIARPASAEAIPWGRDRLAAYACRKASRRRYLAAVGPC
jgi:hypothetical protein